MIKDEGYIYVLSHGFIPNIVKIGKASFINDRLVGMNSTNIPGKYDVVYSQICSTPLHYETKIHSELADYRVTSKREFFQVPVKFAINTVKTVIAEDRDNIEAISSSDTLGKASTMSELGRLLRKKREMRGWTQAHLASLIGTSRATVVQLESGKPNLRAEIMLNAIRALGT